MASRSNGTVKSCGTTDTGGHIVVIEYPEPPPEGETVTYEVLPPLYDECKDALIHDLQIDTTDDDGTPTATLTGTVLHK